MVQKIKNRWDMLEELEGYFGCDWSGNDNELTLLQSIVKAMSDADFKEIYDYIKRTWGFGLEE